MNSDATTLEKDLIHSALGLKLNTMGHRFREEAIKLAEDLIKLGWRKTTPNTKLEAKKNLYLKLLHSDHSLLTKVEIEMMYLLSRDQEIQDYLTERANSKA